jgi:hypothetical protein
MPAAVAPLPSTPSAPEFFHGGLRITSVTPGPLGGRFETQTVNDLHGILPFTTTASRAGAKPHPGYMNCLPAGSDGRGFAGVHRGLEIRRVPVEEEFAGVHGEGLGYWGVNTILEIIKTTGTWTAQHVVQPCPLIRRASVGPPTQLHARRINGPGR